MHDLSPEKREDIEMMVFSSEVEIEDEKRRRCTTFGYDRGGVPTMIWWMTLTLFASVFTVIGLMIANVDLISTTGVRPLFWYVVLPPFIIIPLFPFLFLKLRYALRATAIIVGIFVGVVLMYAGLVSAIS